MKNKVLFIWRHCLFFLASKFTQQTSIQNIMRSDVPTISWQSMRWTWTRNFLVLFSIFCSFYYFPSVSFEWTAHRKLYNLIQRKVFANMPQAAVVAVAQVLRTCSYRDDYEKVKKIPYICFCFLWWRMLTHSPLIPTHLQKIYKMNYATELIQWMQWLTNSVQ